MLINSRRALFQIDVYNSPKGNISVSNRRDAAHEPSLSHVK